MQSRITDQPAFILHRRDYKESSLILELFSEQFGRVSVLANAARKRRDAAHFQICNRLMLGWSGRSELKTLTQIESRVLPVSPKHYPGVFYANELLMLMLPKHQAYAELFHHYQQLLLGLAGSDRQAELAMGLRRFELELLTALGLLPDLTRVSHSDAPLEDTREYYFDPANGLCPAQNQQTRNFLGAQLRAIADRRFDEPDIARAGRILLRQIIDFNLQGRTLQSRQFYQQLQK